jgi:hypothetical protein
MWACFILMLLEFNLSKGAQSLRERRAALEFREKPNINVVIIGIANYSITYSC